MNNTNIIKTEFLISCRICRRMIHCLHVCRQTIRHKMCYPPYSRIICVLPEFSMKLVTHYQYATHSIYLLRLCLIYKYQSGDYAYYHQSKSVAIFEFPKHAS